MALPPPCDRPATIILSLPDELLIDIFTKVKTYRPANKALHQEYASSSFDIAAVRLTCRRFAATSSHLLVHYVRLPGINSQSLHKLEEISRHPLIRKGVRIVRFEARFYVPNLAEDIKVFARWAVERVLSLARRRRWVFEKEVENLTSKDCDIAKSMMRERDQLVVVLRRLKVVLDTWSSFSIDDREDVPVHQLTESAFDSRKDQASELGDRVGSQPHIHLLREAHALYRRRYKEQEELRKDNTFERQFAAAMYRMPNSKRLEFQDFDHEPRTCLTCCDGDEVTHSIRHNRETNDYAGLLDIDFLLEPMSWNDITEHHFGSPPAELLFTLPMALHNAGCRLESILVRTTTRAEDYYPLLRHVLHNNSAALGDAINTMGLKSFSFIHGIDLTARIRKTPTLEDFEAFKGYITAMTSSDSLERFRLAVDSGWADGTLDPESVSASGSLITPTLWRKLTDIHITGLPIRLDDLKSFHDILETSDISLDFLTLARLRLVNGTWTEALDILRKMDITDKEVLEPTGGEADFLRLSLCSEYERIFGRNSGQGNAAGHFIHGHMKENPLKDEHF